MTFQIVNLFRLLDETVWKSDLMLKRKNEDDSLSLRTNHWPFNDNKYFQTLLSIYCYFLYKIRFYLVFHYKVKIKKKKYLYSYGLFNIHLNLFDIEYYYSARSLLLLVNSIPRYYPVTSTNYSSTNNSLSLN